jgi:primary-amine oxidase
MVLSVASRFLVLTEVSPAEYMWNCFFYQDGSIKLKVRLMGIFQTHVAGPNEPAPYATRVAPGIHAHFHQHLFSVCVDPMVDGLMNSVIEMDVLLATTGYSSPENFAGNAFQIHDRVLCQANEGACEWDASADRHWRIVSAGKRHHASGQLTGYSIGVKGGATVALLCLEGWVVHEKDDAREGGRMWPSGKFVLQVREEPVDSLVQWVCDDGDTSERF